MASIHVCSCRFYIWSSGSPFLPISWLFKDIPSLSPSLENGIFWAQPQILMSPGSVAFPRPPLGGQSSGIVTSGLARPPAWWQVSHSVPLLISLLFGECG